MSSSRSRRIARGPTHGVPITSAPADYAAARRRRREIARGLDELLTRVDVLAVPASLRPPPTVAEERGGPPPRAGSPASPGFWASVGGLPSLAVPCGFDGAGLPMGVLLSARRGADLTVLRLAHAYQGLTGWHRSGPPLL